MPTRTTQQVSNDSSSNKKVLLLQASLIKSIVGGGALALPAAVASVGGAEAIPASIFLIGVAATMSSYSFLMLGHVCERTGAKSYLEAWEKTMILGEADIQQQQAAGTQVVSAILSIKTALACIAYSMILADSLHSLFSNVSRVEALAGVTVFALTPLCLLPNLTALAPYSFVGVVGILLTTVFMVLRLLDGTYTTSTDVVADDPLIVPQIDVSMNAADGAHLMRVSDYVPSSAEAVEAGISLDNLALLDHTTAAVVHTDPFNLIGLSCTLATAFVCHYNGPRIYSELQGGKLPAFERLTKFSFAVGAFVMAVIASTGFLTFGADSAPVILSNYAPDDSLMSLSRILIIVSLIATFPLPFLGLRDSLQDNWPFKDKWSLTFGLVLGIALIAGSFDDLGLLLKVGGGTVSTAVAYVIPSLMYLKCEKAAMLPKLLCAVAIVIGITGVTNTLLVSS